VSFLRDQLAYAATKGHTARHRLPVRGGLNNKLKQYNRISRISIVATVYRPQHGAMLSAYHLSYATFAALLVATSACGASSIGSDEGETDDGGSEDEVGTTTAGESDCEASSGSEDSSEYGSEDSSESDSEDSAESDSGSTTGELPKPCLGEVGFAMADSPASTVHVFEPGAEPFDLSVPGPLGMGTTVRVAASEDYLIVATSESYWENGEFVQGSVLHLYPRGSGVPIYELEFARVVQRLYVDPDGIQSAQ